MRSSVVASPPPRLASPTSSRCRRSTWRPTPPGTPTFVGRAAEQARAANPAALVISGLSTRFASTAQTLVDAWTAVRAIVDGHYMAVPEGIRPEVATEFLRQIGASGT